MHSWQRPCLRFSLRSFLLAIGILTVWFGMHMNRVHRQQAAVDTIVRSGGHVFYEYQTDETGLYLPEPKRFQVQPFGPKWIMNWVSPHHFNTVVAVSLGGNISDDELACLAGLPRLKSLGFERTATTNRGLAHLRSLKQLRYLYLGNTAVDDHGLDNISHLRQLLHLQLSPRTTNHGLKHLSEMSKLESLTLCQTQVNDAGLEHLESLTTLDRVLATSTDITEEGASILQSKIPGLTVHVDHPRSQRVTQEIIVRGSFGGEITRFGIYLSATRRVQKILRFSPASRSAIRVGDVIVRVAGKDVGDHAAVVRAVNEQKLGARVEVETLRANKRMKTEVILDNF